MLRTLGRAALDPLRARLPLHRPAPPAGPPGPIERTLAPPSAELAADFVREMGGDPARWHGVVPPHLFPQWGLPLAAETFRSLPYPMHRMLNAGCRLELRSPLPAGEPLRVRASLQGVDDDGRRARIHGLIVTGTARAPEALLAHVEGYVPLAAGRRRAGETARSERPTVPEGSRRIESWRLGPRAGLDFALLTGDFNPLHWVRPYARLLGFRSTLLHGYALLARTLEALVAYELGGDPSRLEALEARFTAPLVLPASPALFVGEDDVLSVGEAPGSRAFLAGRFRRRA